MGVETRNGMRNRNEKSSSKFYRKCDAGKWFRINLEIKRGKKNCDLMNKVQQQNQRNQSRDLR